MRREHDKIPKGAELIFHVNGLISQIDIINNIMPSIMSGSGTITSYGMYLSNNSISQAAASYNLTGTDFGDKLLNSTKIIVEHEAKIILWKSGEKYVNNAIGKSAYSNRNKAIGFGYNDINNPPGDNYYKCVSEFTHNKDLNIIWRRFVTDGVVTLDASYDFNANNDYTKNYVELCCNFWHASGGSFYLKYIKIFVE